MNFVKASVTYAKTSKKRTISFVGYCEWPTFSEKLLPGKNLVGSLHSVKIFLCVVYRNAGSKIEYSYRCGIEGQLLLGRLGWTQTDLKDWKILKYKKEDMKNCNLACISKRNMLILAMKSLWQLGLNELSLRWPYIKS